MATIVLAELQRSESAQGIEEDKNTTECILTDESGTAFDQSGRVTVSEEKLAEQVSFFLGLLRVGIQTKGVVKSERHWVSISFGICDVAGMRIYRWLERSCWREHCQGKGREKRNVGKGKDGGRKKERRQKERERGRQID